MRSALGFLALIGMLGHAQAASVVIPSTTASRIVQGNTLSNATGSGGNAYYIDYAEIAPIIWFSQSGRYDLRRIPKLLDPSVASYKVSYVVIGGGGGGAYGCSPGGAGGLSRLRYRTLNVAAGGGAAGRGAAGLGIRWLDSPTGAAFVGLDGQHGVRQLSNTQSPTVGSRALSFPVRAPVTVGNHGVSPYRFSLAGMGRGDGGRGFGAGGGGVVGTCYWVGRGGGAGSMSKGTFVYDQGTITVTVGAGGWANGYAGRGARGTVGLRFIPQ